LERFIRSCRGELGALVLVIGVNKPAPGIIKFQPGIDERRNRFDLIERAVVEEFADPLVQFIDLDPMYEELGMRGATADGLHLTPEGHGYLGRLLSDQIVKHLPAVMAVR
jgi:lysophospholipase L1-like esterase